MNEQLDIKIHDHIALLYSKSVESFRNGRLASFNYRYT